MASATIGFVKAVLGLESSAFIKGVAKAKASANGLASSLVSLTRTFVGLYAVGNVTAKLKSFTLQMIETGSEISDIAAKLGMTAEEFQTVAYAAEQFGIQTSSLETYFSRFAVNIGKSQSALDELGIAVAKNADGSTNLYETFNDVIQALTDVKDNTDKARIATELFGRGGVDLLTIVNSDAQAFLDLQQQARDLGVVIDEQTINVLDRLCDKLNTLSLTAKGAFTQLIAAALPSLEDVIDRVQSLTEQLGESEGLQWAFDLVAGAIGWVVESLIDLLAYLIELGDTVLVSVHESLVLVGNALRDSFSSENQEAIDNTGVLLANLLKPVNLLKLAIKGLQLLFFGLIVVVEKVATAIYNFFVVVDYRVRKLLVDLMQWTVNTIKSVFADLAKMMDAMRAKLAAADNQYFYPLIEAITKVKMALDDATIAATEAKKSIGDIEAPKLSQGVFGEVGKWARYELDAISSDIDQIIASAATATEASKAAKKKKKATAAVEGIAGGGGGRGKTEEPVSGGETEEREIETPEDYGPKTMPTPPLPFSEEDMAAIALAIEPVDALTAAFDNLKTSLEEMGLSYGDAMNMIVDQTDSMHNIVGGSYDLLAQTFADWVSGTEIGGKKIAAAMLKMTAQTILALGKEAAIKAVFALAEGLLFPAKRAEAFAAAALYGKIAAGALVVGGLLMGAAQTLEKQAQREAAAKEEKPGDEKQSTTTTEAEKEEENIGGVVVNVHVEGHVVDVQDFAERIVAPAVAEAVGKGRATAATYNLVVQRR